MVMPADIEVSLVVPEVLLAAPEASLAVGARVYGAF
jgi:hypothetical protein